MTTEVYRAFSDKWHEARQRVVTGTGVSTIMGCNPYQSEDELLQHYLSPVEPKFSPNAQRRMAWGSMDEGNTGAIVSSCLERAFVSWNFMYIPEGSPIGATTDGYVDRHSLFCEGVKLNIQPEILSGHKKRWDAFLGLSEVHLREDDLWLELKLVGKDIPYGQEKHPWKGSEPPVHYAAQCQAQMHCLDLPRMALVGRVGAHDIRGFMIERDDAFIEEALERSRVFLEKVQEGREL